MLQTFTRVKLFVREHDNFYFLHNAIQIHQHHIHNTIIAILVSWSKYDLDLTCHKSSSVTPPTTPAIWEKIRITPVSSSHLTETPEVNVTTSEVRSSGYLRCERQFSCATWNIDGDHGLHLKPTTYLKGHRIYHSSESTTAGISLGMCPANERHRYNVTTSLIDWAHT